MVETINKRFGCIKISLSFLVFLFCSIVSAYGQQNKQNGYITLETFGAKGDGVFDDSPAFNKCLETGKIIKLAKGKVYTLHSRLSAISHERLTIEGNNAKLIIASDYPLYQYENVFRFDGSITNPKLLKISDLSIACLLGRKFQDKQKRGDTNVFATSKCGEVKLKNVDFTCTTEYNNVSFLVSDGGDVTMDNCHVVLNTRSVQGGIFWMMNKYKKQVNISLNNCYFEHDTQDETMCFSAHGTVAYPTFTMNVNVKNCTFYSNGNTPSSGFIISYNHAEHVFMDADIQYSGCTFKTDGLNKRNIQSYQCGKNGGDYGSFNTKFNKCDFHFNLKRINQNGILSLLPSSNAIPKDSITYEFEKCKFNISNTTTLIGDMDGDKKGVYKFMKCTFVSDASLFNKRYNKGNGLIDIVLIGCKGKLNDETLSSENLYITNSKFENVNGLYLYPKALTYTKNTVLNVKKTWIGGIKYTHAMHPATLKIFTIPKQRHNQITLSDGDVIYGNVNDGRDFGVYYYTSKQPSEVFCVVNGKKIPLVYMAKEQCYFNNIRFKENTFHEGINTILIEKNGQSLAAMSFTIKKG